jgi:hypothetical protein
MDGTDRRVVGGAHAAFSDRAGSGMIGLAGFDDDDLTRAQRRHVFLENVWPLLTGACSCGLLRTHMLGVCQYFIGVRRVAPQPEPSTIVNGPIYR